MYFICTGSLTEMIDSLSLNYKIGLCNRGSDRQSRLGSFSENEFWQVKELVLGWTGETFFQESEQMERRKPWRGCCRRIWRNPRWIFQFSCQPKTLKGRGLMGGKCIWTDNPFFSTPGLIIAFLESMDQPESPSEARLHRGNFPSNLSEVANAKTTTMPPWTTNVLHTGAVSSVWREPKRSWTTSMLLRLACLSGLTSKS